jgi:hypothetical protein
MPRRPMSALGQKRTCAVQTGMSALHPIADMCGALGDVRFVPCGHCVPPYFRVFLSRSIRLEINGFDHAPPFDDVGSKHRVGSFLIKVEGFKAELLETRGHFWIF